MFSFEIKKVYKKWAIALILYLLFSLISLKQLSSTNYGSVDQAYSYFIEFEYFYMNLLVVWISFFSSFSFSMEYERNMMPILHVTKNGRKKFVFTKITIALLLSNVLFLIFFLVILTSWIFAFGFNFNQPIIGEYIESFTVNPSITRMGDILFISLLGTFLNINVTTLVCLFLSNKFKKKLATFVTIVAVSFMVSLCNGIQYIDFISAFSPMSYTQLTVSYSYMLKIMGFNLSLYNIGFVVYILIAVFMIFKLRTMLEVK